MVEDWNLSRALLVTLAGCSTGEEPYSLAILLHELMARLGERPVKIFATDVHRGSLERAARALYDQEAVANVGKHARASTVTVCGTRSRT